ncbi:class I SAM-dependent methyltransferase [Oceanobacter sp. 4_MG-2023]|uniref:class I SAM-dependent methyltransferase n=1 Tax=Oceanobacter sp. 4_MG-2023 TaxID=3062623 RepID=UPI002735B6EF|nr:class I SAM-dependent methyltransferase [Oceanobacter sp. 4_MG-2023]MDP2549140.1 class I SAM-dependent methyltransferase [Oceanobacter sp. 4_MG-2023]
MIPDFRLPVSKEAQRLFHGRGHSEPGFEHINIDWYAPLLLVTVYREPADGWIEQLSRWLIATLPQAEVIGIQYRCRPMAPMEAVVGELPSRLEVTEHGLRYELSFGQFQNTGLFLDMANGRHWVMEHSAGKRVLNLFAYTCGFSVAAVAGGAQRVVNVDMSRRALAIGRENHRLNGHDLGGVVFEGVDIFRSFGRLKKHGPYDLVIADPPTFQKGSVDIRKDYPRLLRRLREMLAPSAELLLCLNAPELGEAFLRQQVADECPEWRYIERLPNPSAFIEVDETAGLKVLRYQSE